MIEFSINGTALSSLGFRVKGASGHLDHASPRRPTTGTDDYTSTNYGLPLTVLNGNEIEVNLVGRFTSNAAAETALYTLYGMLVQVGQRTFSHASGGTSVQFRGVLHKGSVVSRQAEGEKIVFDVKLRILKTDVV